MGGFKSRSSLCSCWRVTKPLGVYMTRVFNRERTFMDPVLRPIERC